MRLKPCFWDLSHPIGCSWQCNKISGASFLQGASQFLTRIRASARASKITQINFFFACYDPLFSVIFCYIPVSMDVTFASGWLTPAGAHASGVLFLGLAPKFLITKSRPVRRTSRLAGDALIMLPINFHFAPACMASRG